MFDLNGKWDFSDSSEQYRLSVTFPGDAISALHGAGLIPDPIGVAMNMICDGLPNAIGGHHVPLRWKRWIVIWCFQA